MHFEPYVLDATGDWFKLDYTYDSSLEYSRDVWCIERNVACGYPLEVTRKLTIICGFCGKRESFTTKLNLYIEKIMQVRKPEWKGYNYKEGTTGWYKYVACPDCITACDVASEL